MVGSTSKNGQWGRWRSCVGVLGIALIGCDEGLGSEGSQLPASLEQLSGGVIFSTAVLNGANGYDLFWAPVSGASPVNEQGVLQLTTTGSNDFQPSLSRDAQALVFAREGEGIFLVDASGRVSRVSDTRGTPWVDTLPTVNPDRSRVAWVREDRSRPLGAFDLVATEIWVANADGSEARAVSPKQGIIQDAPAFDPASRSQRLAWSEFEATSLGPNGPTNFGLWLHDLEAFTGRFICRGTQQDRSGNIVRCFGQHLAWPAPNRLVLTQQLLEIDPITGSLASRLPALLNGLASAPGTIDRTRSESGFFPPFPISGHYAGTLLVVDGVFTPFDGDQPTLAFFISDRDASNPTRFRVSGLQADLDTIGTAGYLFSLATPQLVP